MHIFQYVSTYLIGIWNANYTARFNAHCSRKPTLWQKLWHCLHFRHDVLWLRYLQISSLSTLKKLRSVLSNLFEIVKDLPCFSGVEGKDDPFSFDPEDCFSFRAPKAFDSPFPILHVVCSVWKTHIAFLVHIFSSLLRLLVTGVNYFNALVLDSSWDMAW